MGADGEFCKHCVAVGLAWLENIEQNSELASLQDAAPSESPGSVVNPVWGEPYLLDTCCGALAFATEYRRVGDSRWRTRAGKAVDAARSGMLCRGIAEPAWDVFGWHLVPGSLPITGIAVDAYWSALDRLSIPFDEAGVADLLDFLLRCRMKSGGFAHNELSDEHSKDVQNATASALNLLACVASREGGEGHPVWTGLDATRSRLQRGQDIGGSGRTSIRAAACARPSTGH